MDLIRPEEVFAFVDEQRTAGRKAIVANHNLHSLYLLRREPAMRTFYDRAQLIEVDSTPLIWWARLMGHPTQSFHRCTYLDWRDAFWAEAGAKSWRVFFVGGAPGVGERARAAIISRWPGTMLGVHHGYFNRDPDSSDCQAVLAAIADFKPNVLFVGMGMPLQETWILDGYDQLPACVIFPIGGAFDYEAGVQQTCPRWLGRIGLEWLYRLCGNPRRLFRRYCVEPFDLAGPALQDLRARRQQPDPSPRAAP